MDAAAGHNKTAQKGESPKGGATGGILNFTTANADLCPANTVRNITFVKVLFSSFMDERNEDMLGT